MGASDVRPASKQQPYTSIVHIVVRLIFAVVTKAVRFTLRPATLVTFLAAGGTCCCLHCGTTDELLGEILIGTMGGGMVMLLLVAEEQRRQISQGKSYNLLLGLQHHSKEVLLGALGGFLLGNALHMLHHWI